MAASESHIPGAKPVWLRYGLAFVSVVFAVVPSVILQHYNFHDVELQLFLFAVAVTAWYGGVGPAIVAIVLSVLSFDYFFTVPLYSFDFTPSDIPQLVILVLFATLITRFSAVRRRVEGDLVQARDELQKEVIERTRQASLLNLTHDMIFVRDMEAVIRYWNRGAEELYGYIAEQAIGKRSHELLRTVFPAPIDALEATLEQTGRWEGELRHTKADQTEVVVSSRWSLLVPAEFGGNMVVPSIRIRNACSTLSR
jgi:PAS domain S-box-containing protein